MKLTTKLIKQLIKEELQRINEGSDLNDPSKDPARDRLNKIKAAEAAIKIIPPQASKDKIKAALEKIPVLDVDDYIILVDQNDAIGLLNTITKKFDIINGYWKGRNGWYAKWKDV
mgnify:CR=1 FL=1